MIYESQASDNNIIILGCILCYISVVLFGLDARIFSTEEYTSNCNVRHNFLLFVFRKLPNDYRLTKAKTHLANHHRNRSNWLLKMKRPLTFATEICVPSQAWLNFAPTRQTENLLAIKIHTSKRFALLLAIS